MADAYRLVHDGALALSRAEQQGIRIDVEYCRRETTRLEREIRRLDRKFRLSEFAGKWSNRFGAKCNFGSSDQLATMLYQVEGITPPRRTASGKGSTDENALRQAGIEELEYLLRVKKLKKIKDTYLGGFLRAEVNGWIHPSFSLHLVTTYRSCIAEGTKVLVVKDFEQHPNGIPIEDVRRGDLVYCFDDRLQPAIRRALWAGKTGRRKIVRVHWRGARGNRGFLDVTPEHKIRHISGNYVEARNLVGDLRGKRESLHAPRVRVLSCNRRGDRLNFTWHNNQGGSGLLESRLIYQRLIGPLADSEVVHHVNGNHFDHRLENLQKETQSSHAAYHAARVSEETRAKQIDALRKNRHKITYKRGSQHHRSSNLSRWACLKALAKVKGKVSLVSYDFVTFKKYCNDHEIDPRVVKSRYNRKGQYVPRHWANTDNHQVTKVEWLEEERDVYDIEVEDFHNFFANEICVHNSSQNPNFQNIPARDKESMKICRQAIVPRPGHQFVSFDFVGIEVAVSACYHKDPEMLRYLDDPKSDMHSDTAHTIFLLDDFDEQIQDAGGMKLIPELYSLRYAAKNGFVFPQFYGDYYGNCAFSLACDWGRLPPGKWKRGQGVLLPGDINLSDHLIAKGLHSLHEFTDHIERIEDDFWNKRFKVYGKWKKEWYAKYQEDGHFDMLTGFRCQGLMRRNEAINYPVQGPAFHCLLWTFIETDRIMRKEQWDSKLVGQIHDYLLIDAHPNETQHVIDVVRHIVRRRLTRAWPWIIVPLEVEVEVGPVDGSWVETHPVSF